MPTIADYYQRVNDAWGYELMRTNRGHVLVGGPDLTPEEAVNAAAKLWRYVTGNSCPYVIETTTGNRYTWVKGGVLKVNYEHGWYELVHMLGHYLLRYVSNAKPHSKDHARLELRLVKQVLKRGWLAGSLKTEPKAEPIEEKPTHADKLAHIDAAIKRWETKHKRATTALKKLARRRSYYARAVATS